MKTSNKMLLGLVGAIIVLEIFQIFHLASCAVLPIKGNGNLVTSEKVFPTFEKMSNK